jgi:D-glycero-alpha-D-manno-heptose-7-phosphate kinase
MRISLGGGGTDLPSYYRKYGGFCLSAAIDKYVYIILHETFEREIILKYSKLERCQLTSQIEHPIFREALKLVGLESPNLEVASMADIPAGTGLGSSGAFTCALLKALCRYLRNDCKTSNIAEQACKVELECGPAGKQDQYISAFGGLNCFNFNPHDTVQVEPLRISTETRLNLEFNLLLLFTGFTRDASAILEEQVARSSENLIVDNLHHVKELGESIRTSLENGNLEMFAGLLNAHWAFKKRRSRSMTSNEIDRWYDLALANGALGGKLVGAGGGGFLLFYCSDKEKCRKVMTSQGLKEVRFQFDFVGTKVLSL